MGVWKTSTDFEFNIKHASPFFRMNYETEFTNGLTECQGNV